MSKERAEKLDNLFNKLDAQIEHSNSLSSQESLIKRTENILKEFKDELNKQFAASIKKQIDDGKLSIKNNKRTTIHLGWNFERWLKASLMYSLINADNSDHEYLIKNKTKICENIIASDVVRPVKAGMYQNGRRHIYNSGISGGIIGSIISGVVRFLMIPVNWIRDFNTIQADDLPKSALTSTMLVEPRQIIDQIGQLNTHPIESLPPASLIGNYLRNCAISNRVGLPFDKIPSPDSPQSLYKGGKFDEYNYKTAKQPAKEGTVEYYREKARKSDKEFDKELGEYPMIKNIMYITDKDADIKKQENVNVVTINGQSFISGKSFADKIKDTVTISGNNNTIELG